MNKRTRSKKQTAKFRAKLLAMQSEVMTKVNGGLHGIRQSGDTGDVAQSEMFVQLDLSMRQKDREVLAGIQAALSRIGQGNFGICIECGEDIPLKRLETAPTACLCLECKTEQEYAQARLFGRKPTYVGA
ncbi:TraR/DksA family transcriptional regulator [Patescibacteria group bacterium]